MKQAVIEPYLHAFFVLSNVLNHVAYGRSSPEIVFHSQEQVSDAVEALPNDNELGDLLQQLIHTKDAFLAILLQ